MKKLLLLLLLILIGCSETEPEPIDIGTLNFRNETYYPINSDKPYSGSIFTLYENGQLEYEGTIKNGNKHGLWKRYDSNEQLYLEEIYNNGELVERKIIYNYLEYFLVALLIVFIVIISWFLLNIKKLKNL